MSEEERRQGFHEISRAIGRIEGKVEGLKESTDAQWDKLEAIESALTAHRIKTAGLATIVSAVVTGLVHLFKGGTH